MPPVSAPVAPPPAGGRSVLPPEIPQVWLPAQPAAVAWRPVLLGLGRVHVEDRKLGAQADRDVLAVVPVADGPLPVDWSAALEVGVDPARLTSEPAADLDFQPLPSTLADPKRHARWSKEFADWLYRNQTLQLWQSPALGVVSQPGEAERDFRARLAQAARERRDAEVEALQKRYAPRMERLKDRLDRAEEAAQKQEADVSQQRVSTAVSFGTTLMGALFGRKALSVSNVTRAGTALRSASRSKEEERQLGRAREKVGEAQEEMQALEAEFQAEVQALQARVDPATELLQVVELRPRKTDVSVRLVAVGWAPVGPSGQPAWKQ